MLVAAQEAKSCNGINERWPGRYSDLPGCTADVQNGNQTPDAKSMAALAATQGKGSEAKPVGTTVGYSSCGVCSSSKSLTKALMGPTEATGRTVVQVMPATMDKASLQITSYGLVKPRRRREWHTRRRRRRWRCRWRRRRQGKLQLGRKTVGGSGGGGGSGGCGGTGGGFGTAGGASFGVFAYWSQAPATFPSVSNNTVYRGFGGAGGDGGLAALAGLAGLEPRVAHRARAGTSRLTSAVKVAALAVRVARAEPEVEVPADVGGLAMDSSRGHGARAHRSNHVE